MCYNLTKLGVKLYEEKNNIYYCPFEIKLSLFIEIQNHSVNTKLIYNLIDQKS